MWSSRRNPGYIMVCALSVRQRAAAAYRDTERRAPRRASGGLAVCSRYLDSVQPFVSVQFSHAEGPGRGRGVGCMHLLPLSPIVLSASARQARKVETAVFCICNRPPRLCRFFARCLCLLPAVCPPCSSSQLSPRHECVCVPSLRQTTAPEHTATP